MKLLTTSADSENFEPRSSLYAATRRLSNELEDMGNFSLQALQAKVLLAYYELGHAIYPAAYLATGSCAKYGIALGLHNASHQTVQTLSLDEAEERRRTWWAILVLERCIRLGYPDHVLLTPEPNIWDYLPIDDDVWDNQVIVIRVCTPGWQCAGSDFKLRNNGALKATKSNIESKSEFTASASSSTAYGSNREYGSVDEPKEALPPPTVLGPWITGPKSIIMCNPEVRDRRIKDHDLKILRGFNGIKELCQI
ncbi:hypothetical protein TrVGV298_009980 [Trichoderma virens]|nr:hypothetical protein TrVGV298_009980 [Trichoderma virens]